MNIKKAVNSICTFSSSEDLSEEEIEDISTSQPTERTTENNQLKDESSLNSTTEKQENVQLLPEIEQISAFFKTLRSKFYYCGFVYSINALSATGKRMFQINSNRENPDWEKFWMELWGPFLTLWKVPDELASFSYTANISMEQFIKNELEPPLELMAMIKSYSTNPILINISDSISELFKPDFHQFLFQGSPEPPIPYSSYFGLNTAASNLYLFSCASFIQSNSWVAAIRLSLFEISRLQQAFTLRWLKQQNKMPLWDRLKLEPLKSHLFRGDVNYSCRLQVRIPYSNRNYY